MTRLILALRMYLKCGIGLSWTPRTAWKIAGTIMEMREFCREHKITLEGNWLVWRSDV